MGTFFTKWKIIFPEASLWCMNFLIPIVLLNAFFLSRILIHAMLYFGKLVRSDYASFSKIISLLSLGFFLWYRCWYLHANSFHPCTMQIVEIPGVDWVKYWCSLLQDGLGPHLIKRLQEYRYVWYYHFDVLLYVESRS